jgi:Protein of unknown function (DUF3096)
MAERVDGRGRDAIADIAAQGPAGQNVVHFASLLRCRETRRRAPMFPRYATQWKVRPMMLDIIAIQPLVALIAGILILLVPRLLNYVVAIYLILIGLIGLWPRLFYHFPH